MKARPDGALDDFLRCLVIYICCHLITIFLAYIYTPSSAGFLTIGKIKVEGFACSQRLPVQSGVYIVRITKYAVAEDVDFAIRCRRNRGWPRRITG